MGQITFVTGPAVIIGEEGGEQWNPVFENVQDGTRVVKRVSDWTGGTGDKPAIGMYVGAAGYVENIADAVDFSGIVAPVVSAGTAQQLRATATSTTLTGVAIPGTEGAFITGYQWEKVSGPADNDPAIKNAAGPQTEVTGLVAGNYVFRLTATDNNGQASFSTVAIKVNTPARWVLYGPYVAETEQYLWIHYPEGDDDPAVPRPTCLYLAPLGLNGAYTGNNMNAFLTVEEAGLSYCIAQGMPWGLRTVVPMRIAGLWSSDTLGYQAWTFAKTIITTDANKNSLFGASSGGGVLNILAAHPEEFAYAEVACPVDSQAKNFPQSFANTRVKFIHCMQDTNVAIDSAGSTWEVVNIVNDYATPPRYSPQVAVIFDLRMAADNEAHTAALWNDHAWNKYRSWYLSDLEALMYDKREVEVARNFVNKAAYTEKLRDYMEAAWLVGNLSAGADKTALQAALAAIAPDDTFVLNLGSTEGAFSPYAINSAPSPANGATVTDLRDIKGNVTGLSHTVVTNGGVPYTAGMNASHFGLSPLMMRTGFPVTQVTSTLKISGIPAGKFVDVYVFYSDRSTSKTDISGFWIKANNAVQGTTRQAPWNTSYTVDLIGVPEVGGEVVLDMQALNAQGGTIIALAWQIKDDDAVEWSTMIDFRETAATAPGWLPFIAQPSNGIRTLVDPVKLITMSTVATGPDFWQNFATTFYHSDVEGPDLDTYPSWMPKQVGRGALFSLGTTFKRAAQNYNIQFTMAGGWPLGPYRVRLFACTKNGGNNTLAQYIGKIGDSGINKHMLAAYSGSATVVTGRWLEFFGTMTELLQDMKFAGHINAAAGLAFWNAIKIEKLKR